MDVSVVGMDNNTPIKSASRPRKVFKEQIVALKAQGWQDIQIARKLGICRRSVQRALSEHKQAQEISTKY